jgi:hypothetical protein
MILNVGALNLLPTILSRCQKVLSTPALPYIQRLKEK